MSDGKLFIVEPEDLQAKDIKVCDVRVKVTRTQLEEALRGDNVILETRFPDGPLLQIVLEVK